jgi:hypothetical protein
MNYRIAFPPAAHLEVSHARVNELADFLAQRLGADDYAKAEALLRASLFPAHAAALHAAAAITEGTPT